MHTIEEGTIIIIKDLFEMKVVQVAMLIILALLTVCCGFHIVRGQQSQRQRISQGKLTVIFVTRGVELPCQHTLIMTANP